mmetsp:Transcript_18475/g.39327  ORF Transcript_18475/g.39327 Transcript_18475/m.39327 type:complete len:233 (-) Transcript_18475:803-1501(-)
MAVLEVLLLLNPPQAHQKPQTDAMVVLGQVEDMPVATLLVCADGIEDVGDAQALPNLNDVLDGKSPFLPKDAFGILVEGRPKVQTPRKEHDVELLPPTLAWHGIEEALKLLRIDEEVLCRGPEGLEARLFGDSRRVVVPEKGAERRDLTFPQRERPLACWPSQRGYVVEGEHTRPDEAVTWEHPRFRVGLGLPVEDEVPDADPVAAFSGVQKLRTASRRCLPSRSHKDALCR